MTATNKKSVAKKPTPVIAVCNHKGGVGKTTTVVNLAYEFGSLGLSVLVIDLDPQGNTSNHIGEERFEFLSNNITGLLCDQTSSGDLDKIFSVVNDKTNDGFKNVYYIPSCPALDRIVLETIKINSVRPAEELRIRLDILKEGFDVVLIDCPPTLSTLVDNAISAASHFVVPIDSGTEYSTSGWVSLMDHIDKISKVTNPGLIYLGALLTRHNQNLINKAIADHVGTLEGEKNGVEGERIIPLYIHASTKIGEASALKKPVSLVAKNSNVAMDYRNLAKYLVRTIGIKKKR